MFVRHRFLPACFFALAVMLMAIPLGQAAEPSTLSDHELDLVTAGGTATERRSVARLARLVDYEVATLRHGLGFADRPRDTAIALLLPAVQAAGEAAQANDRVGGGFFYLHD